MAASLGLDQSGIAELNARWENEFFPSVKRVNPSAISMDNSYEFGEMVGKINHILSDGKKACLFIGRTAGEALPPSDQKEEWISADIFRVNSGEEGLTGRIHLWIDCNQQDAIEPLRGLFDRIVIDGATIKFLRDDFAKRFSVMLRSKDSFMIFETSTRQWAKNNVSETTFSKESYNVLYPLDDLNKHSEKLQSYMRAYYPLKQSQKSTKIIQNSTKPEFNDRPLTPEKPSELTTTK